jgi:hypothetical protein
MYSHKSGETPGPPVVSANAQEFNIPSLGPFSVVRHYFDRLLNGTLYTFSDGVTFSINVIYTEAAQAEHQVQIARSNPFFYFPGQLLPVQIKINRHDVFFLIYLSRYADFKAAILFAMILSGIKQIKCQKKNFTLSI